MKYTVLVTIISLVVTLVFGARVGMMRAKFNIEAPSLTIVAFLIKVLLFIVSLKQNLVLVSKHQKLLLK